MRNGCILGHNESSRLCNHLQPLLTEGTICHHLSEWIRNSLLLEISSTGTTTNIRCMTEPYHSLDLPVSLRIKHIWLFPFNCRKEVNDILIFLQSRVC